MTQQKLTEEKVHTTTRADTSRHAQELRGIGGVNEQAANKTTRIAPPMLCTVVNVEQPAEEGVATPPNLTSGKSVDQTRRARQLSLAASALTMLLGAVGLCLRPSEGANHTGLLTKEQTNQLLSLNSFCNPDSAGNLNDSSTGIDTPTEISRYKHKK